MGVERCVLGYILYIYIYIYFLWACCGNTERPTDLLSVGTHKNFVFICRVLAATVNFNVGYGFVYQRIVESSSSSSSSSH